MKRGLLFAALLIALGAGIAYTVLTPTAHDFTEAECPDCHAATPVKGRPEARMMKNSISFLCLRCHPAMEKTVSHPVEVVPVEARVPEDLPLSRDGRMTCSTCHDIHARPKAPFGLATSFLRRSVSGAAFCSACHASGPTAGHAMMMGRAHMKFRSEEGGGGSVDAVSRACLGCHDGSIGPNSSVMAGSWEHGMPLSKFDPRGSHPIGVSYLQAMARRGGLIPLGALNPAIKLIDGKVGCSSCHNPYSKEQSKLVMSNRGSRLCLACHNK